jgi:hypothetical protein
MNDVGDGAFDFFSAEGVGNVWHFQDKSRDVSGGCGSPQPSPELVSESVREGETFDGLHEEDDALVTLPALAYGKTIVDLLNPLDHAVDLRCADANPSGF